MPDDVLSCEQKSALEHLVAAGVGGSYYLAGEIGLSLRLGHRRSVDLDFFCPDAGASLPLRAQIGRLPGLRVEDERAGTLHVSLDGVKASFLSYPYPLLEPAEILPPGIPVASLADLAAMKLSTIIARGRRRDFVDLFEIAKRLPLERILDAFRRKTGEVNYNPLITAKALVYFVDAEKDPAPVLLRPCDWGDVKRFFESEVRKLWP